MVDADAFYPSMAPAAAPEPLPAGPEIKQAETPDSDTPKPSTEEDLADALYGQKDEPLPELEVPPAVKDLRKDDTARLFYSAEKQFANVLNERTLFAEESAAEQVAPELRGAVVKEVANMAADLGMSVGDINTLRTVAQVCDVTPPNDETRIQWREQAVQRLNETYGEGAAQAYRDAIKFAQRDPRWVKALNENGRGDHPDSVLLFAKLARQAKVAGRLK